VIGNKALRRIFGPDSVEVTVNGENCIIRSMRNVYKMSETLKGNDHVEERTKDEKQISKLSRVWVCRLDSSGSQQESVMV
jgi:ferritin-like protein